MLDVSVESHVSFFTTSTARDDVGPVAQKLTWLQLVRVLKKPNLELQRLAQRMWREMPRLLPLLRLLRSLKCLQSPRTKLEVEKTL